MANYTKASFEFGGDMKMLRFLQDDLHLSCMGLGLGRIPPGKGWPFFHTHEKQEEVYICLDGTLTMIVDGEEVALTAGDIVRVPPEASRAVGNRTTQPGTILIVGAMPFETQYKGETGRSHIRDGQPIEGEPPDWSVAD